MDSFIAALCVFACLIGGATEKLRSRFRKQRRKREKVEGVVRAQGREEGWTEIAGTVEAKQSENGSHTSYEVSLWHRPLDDGGNE